HLHVLRRKPLEVTRQPHGKLPSWVTHQLREEHPLCSRNPPRIPPSPPAKRCSCSARACRPSASPAHTTGRTRRGSSGRSIPSRWPGRQRRASELEREIRAPKVGPP